MVMRLGGCLVCGCVVEGGVEDGEGDVEFLAELLYVGAVCLVGYVVHDDVDRLNGDAGFMDALLFSEELDEHEDITIACLCLINDMYSERDYKVDRTNLNPTVETILSMHSRNYL